jgi:hypothetical protein
VVIILRGCVRVRVQNHHKHAFPPSSHTLARSHLIFEDYTEVLLPMASSALKDVCFVQKAVLSAQLVCLRRGFSELCIVTLRFIMCSRYMNIKPLSSARGC